jgi:hypothetical protein
MEGLRVIFSGKILDFCRLDTPPPRRAEFLSDRVILEILHHTLTGSTNQVPAATAAAPIASVGWFAASNDMIPWSLAD